MGCLLSTRNYRVERRYFQAIVKGRLDVFGSHFGLGARKKGFHEAIAHDLNVQTEPAVYWPRAVSEIEGLVKPRLGRIKVSLADADVDCLDVLMDLGNCVVRAILCETAVPTPY